MKLVKKVDKETKRRTEEQSELRETLRKKDLTAAPGHLPNYFKNMQKQAAIENKKTL